MSLVAGIVRVQGIRAEGLTVRAHRRSTGELIAETVSDSEGNYQLDVGPFGDQCFVIVLPLTTAGDLPSFNAFVKDQFTDITDENFLMTEDDDAIATEDGQFIIADAI